MMPLRAGWEGKRTMRREKVTIGFQLNELTLPQ
jgi:hypothetical protein